MTELKEEDKPTYVLSYPRWVRLVRLGLVVLLAGTALARWIMAWINFFRPVIQAVRGATETLSELAPLLGQVITAQPLRPLLAAHLGLILTLGSIACIYAFLADLSIADDGLAVRTLWGWRVIPWTTIKFVRITSFENKKRRLVLIQGRWARMTIWPRLVSACLGAGFEPGVLLTSALRDFGPLMRRMYEEVNKAVPDALFDDEFLSPSALVTVEPVPTFAALAEQARDEGWPTSISTQAMGAVAGGLALVQLLVLLMVGGAWWKPIAIIGLCGVEWVIGALYLYALTEIFPAHVEFREGVLLYPMAQIPRALMALPMAMFVAAGVPFLAAALSLVGVLWAVILTALLVQELYRLKSILPAMVGGAIQALFLFIVLAMIFTG
jgi:hypothetical protein